MVVVIAPQLRYALADVGEVACLLIYFVISPIVRVLSASNTTII